MVRLGNKLKSERIAAGLEIRAAPANGASALPRSQAEADQSKALRLERQPWERQPVYMPSFLVATTLPHTDPGTTEFTRVNGNVETTVFTRKKAGLPFGVYPRLIVIELATHAVRTKSRQLVIGRTINNLLARMGISNRGGKHGQATRARDQLDRLCWVEFGTTHRSKYGPEKMDVADRWLRRTKNGLEITLSERFFRQVTNSAVPLDPVILRSVRRSPLSIDTYAWITERMARLETRTAITWPVLEKQFGCEYKDPRQFRRRFRQAVDRVREAWPAELGIDVQDRRVIIDPGPPSVGSRLERHDAKHE